MAVLITANSANTICFALTCALFAATCHASSSGHDYKIRDSSPSLQHTADAISSEHTRSNRKLMAVKSDWTPLWADEFDSWDGERWQHHWGDGCQIGLCGWGNQELEFYTNNPNNSRIVDGNLVIEAKEVAGTEQAAVQQECWDECGRRCVTEGYIDGTPELHTCVLSCGNGRCPEIRFTSARISTVNKFSISPSAKFSTIRVEARIQLTPGTGLWPAFWMLPQDSKYGIWPSSGEIDIMESHTAMLAVNGTIHYGGSGDQWRHTTVARSLSPGFHVFRVDWSEKEMRWYLDHMLYGTVANTGNNKGWYSAGSSGSPTAPFGAGDNFYLLLNMAVGGAYPGFPSSDSIAQSMAEGPKQMVVDYVRVFGR
ncbi:hypothetical protein Ndes2526B_g03323 [Nannochloris sp. 'desiccata']